MLTTKAKKMSTKNKIWKKLGNGELGQDEVIEACLDYMPEGDLANMADANGWTDEDEVVDEDEDNEDITMPENPNWHGWEGSQGWDFQRLIISLKERLQENVRLLVNNAGIITWQKTAASLTEQKRHCVGYGKTKAREVVK